MNERQRELMVEVATDVFTFEEEKKRTLSAKHKAFLISELVNSCMSRGVAYKDNPLRDVLFSLPWK